MSSERGMSGPAIRATVPVAAPFPSSLPAPRVVVPLLVAEIAAFVLVAASGKIPEFLFTAIRALLTF